MNAELKARWVTALRSGDYKQGKRKLRSLDNKFCCLGVLCDLMDPTWKKGQFGYMWKDTPNAGQPPYKEDCYKGEGDAMIDLPKSQGARLVDMNDDDVHSKTFDEIAEWIVANVRVTS